MLPSNILVLMQKQDVVVIFILEMDVRWFYVWRFKTIYSNLFRIDKVWKAFIDLRRDDPPQNCSIGSLMLILCDMGKEGADCSFGTRVKSQVFTLFWIYRGTQTPFWPRMFYSVPGSKGLIPTIWNVIWNTYTAGEKHQSMIRQTIFTKKHATSYWQSHGRKWKGRKGNSAYQTLWTFILVGRETSKGGKEVRSNPAPWYAGADKQNPKSSALKSDYPGLKKENGSTSRNWFKMSFRHEQVNQSWKRITNQSSRNEKKCIFNLKNRPLRRA